jgi:hypothetical protein
MGSDFADPQKRPDKKIEQPIQKPLQINDIWSQPKKKMAGYGAGGYGKTAPGMRQFSVYELATGVRPETLIEQAASSPDSDYGKNVPHLKGNDPFGLDAQVYGPDAWMKPDKTQAELEQDSGVPITAAPMQLVSAAVKGYGSEPKSPEQQLQHKFETNVAAKAQGLLKANKDRLNAEQTAYLQDNNPKGDRWNHLWQVAAQRR